MRAGERRRDVAVPNGVIKRVLNARQSTLKICARQPGFMVSDIWRLRPRGICRDGSAIELQYDRNSWE